MADNARAYSFYIPAGDKSLAEFIDAQSNLSMTIRLVLKAFAENYRDRYPDVPTMDIKELVRNADISAERLAELAAEEDAERKARDGGSMKDAEDGAPEHDAGEEEQAGEEQDEAEYEDTDTEYGGAGYDDDEDDENDGGEIIDLGSDDDDDDDENEAENTGGSGQGGIADDVPKTETKPEAPAQKPAEQDTKKEAPAAKDTPAPKSEARENLRKAYNSQQESRQAATLDDLNSDIEDLMGDIG